MHKPGQYPLLPPFTVTIPSQPLEQPPSVCLGTLVHVTIMLAESAKIQVLVWKLLGTPQSRKVNVSLGRWATLSSSWSPLHWACVYPLLAFFRCYLLGSPICLLKSETQWCSLQEICNLRREEILLKSPAPLWSLGKLLGRQLSHQRALYILPKKLREDLELTFPGCMASKLKDAMVLIQRI